MAKPKPQSSSIPTITVLGNRVSAYTGLETFPKPDLCVEVTLTSDEVTAVCPITNQPDWYTVTVQYMPDEKCVESKTFKLFMHSLRNEGMFCEALASFILAEFVRYVEPKNALCRIVQKPRGGVEIISESVWRKQS